MSTKSRIIIGIALTLCILLTSFNSVSAQSISPLAQATPGTISVTGDAQINVVPDKVLITLGVESTEQNLADAKSGNDANIARILTLTQNFKIEAKDVQTDHISIQPRYDNSSLHIVGYTVRKTIVITLRDISKFDDVLSGAINSGANVVQGVQFLTSDLRKYRDQARDLAIKAAREKADALASALGQKAGRALTISEQRNSWFSYYGSWWGQSSSLQMQNVVQNAPNGSTGDLGEGETTAPGQISVTASVAVTFELTD
jgi:uncharacterized protein YggE